MPAGAIGSCWAAGSWPNTAWEAGSWGASAPSPVVSRRPGLGGTFAHPTPSFPLPTPRPRDGSLAVVLVRAEGHGVKLAAQAAVTLTPIAAARGGGLKRVRAGSVATASQPSIVRMEGVAEDLELLIAAYLRQTGRA